MSARVGDLCVLLETVESEEGEATDTKVQGYQHALEELLELIRREGEEDTERSVGGKESLSQASWARLLVVAAGHAGTHYWTNHSSRMLANGKISSYNNIYLA